MDRLLAQIGNATNSASRFATGQDAEAAQGDFLDTVLSALSVFKNVVISLVIIFIFYLIGKLIARRIINALKQAKGESLYPDMVVLINRFAVFGSLFVGVAVVIQFIFDLDFIQVVGFFGLGISFAFKDLLANLIAGAVIILQNRFRIGDFIQVGQDGLKGKIMEIQTRATILKAIDDTEIVIPNAELLIKPVISFTAHHKRRIDFIIGISYSSDISTARKVAIETMEAHPHVLKDPAPHVLVDQVADSSINLSMRFFVDPKNKDASWIVIKSELTQAVKEAFDKNGIDIPFPIRTLQGNVAMGKTEQKENPPQKNSNDEGMAMASGLPEAA